MFATTERDAKRILDTLIENKLTLKMMIITHGHLDHVGSVKYLKEKTGAVILMHAADRAQGRRPAGRPTQRTPISSKAAW